MHFPILQQIDRWIFVHIDPPSCIQRPLIFLRVFPHPWRNDSSLSDVVKAKSDVGCGRITENSPSKLNFPRKCRLKEQVTLKLPVGSWGWEKESGVEGCPKRESKESLPLRGLIRQWIFIRSLRISYSFKYWGCLSCPRLMTDSKWFAFCLHRMFVANFIFHVVISCSIEIAFCKIN